MFADARTPTSRFVQASAMPVSPTRSIIAPVAPSSRTAASMTAWRISSWSWVALTRPAISRSVRSASAVRASSSRERASWSIKRALVIAIAAWLARAPTRPASVWVNAARSFA